MQKLSFQHSNGIVEGIYFSVKEEAPLVIIINGHNGFYNYGMFPYIQKSLAENGIATYSFNFSHGGVKGDEDYFVDLESYERNCMRLEIEDAMCVLHNLNSETFKNHSEVFLMAHSLGGVPAIFTASKAPYENINIAGLILISTVKQLNFWPEEMLKEWEQNKVYYKKNNRTMQMLPQGEEFLNEVLESDSKWNVENEIKKLKQPILILHGENDEAIPVEHSQSKYEWVKSNNENTSLKIIPRATHTFNTKHPFTEPSSQLEEMINQVIVFTKSI
ncbi:MAG: dienelactone hydrolase family protein [Ginsengibacter sp.]